MARNYSHMGTGARLTGSGCFAHRPPMPTQHDLCTSSMTPSGGSLASSAASKPSRPASASYLTSSQAISGVAHLRPRRGFGETHQAAAAAAQVSPPAASVSISRSAAFGLSGTRFSQGHLSTYWPIQTQPLSRAAWEAHREARWPSVQSRLDAPLRPVKVPWALPR